MTDQLESENDNDSHGSEENNEVWTLSGLKEEMEKVDQYIARNIEKGGYSKCFSYK